MASEIKQDYYFVHLFNDFSGSPRVLKDFIEQGTPKAARKHLLTSSHDGFLDGVSAKRHSILYRRSSNRWCQLAYYLLSQCYLFLLMTLLLVGNRLRGRRAIVVINTLLPFGAALPARLLATETIAYVHESCIKPQLLKSFLRLMVEHCASRVVFVSQYLREIEAFKRPCQTVIYNGLSRDFDKLTVSLEPAQKFSAKQVLFAGSLKDYKGVRQFVQLASMPDCQGFRFVMALNAGMDEIAHYFRGESLPTNLQLLSRPSNLATLYAESFLVVNFSLPEGWVETFGLSLLEGMHYGCPVIAPPVGGPTEFVNQSNGALIDSRQTEEITRFLNELSSSYDTWTKYSEQALQTAAKFSNNNYCKTVNRYLAAL